MRLLVGAFAGGLAFLGSVVVAQAGPVPVHGSFEIQYGTGAGGTFGHGVEANFTVVVSSPGGGSHLTALTLPPTAFQTTGARVDVTDPFLSPIEELLLTAVGGGGVLATSAGFLGGTLAVSGVSKICLFATCDAAIVPANISVPLNVVGIGGTTTFTGIIAGTIGGAPWTTGTVQLTPPSFTLTSAPLTAMGFAHGPGSATSTTGLPGGVVSAVTPIFIRTNQGTNPVLPSFATLRLEIVPEPSTVFLLGAGILALGEIGRRRRR